MKSYDTYIETKDFPGNTHIQISVYYSKGGMNYFSGESSQRGFYVSVTPVQKSNGCISTVLFSGLKQLILNASRYSEKQHNIAIEASKEITPKLMEALKAKAAA